ncbi:MAG: hypothetical protein ACI9ZT_001371 [Gammaproteobacteria bacterium]|jgi:hypothetical protein
MDSKDQIEKRNNFIIVLSGIILVVGLILIYREGLSWFSLTRWSQVSTLSWAYIIAIFAISLILQYYFLMLLRYSSFKYLVLWFIPIIWLVNNGLVAMHRFLDWTTDIISPSGWIPLVGSGVIVAMIDSSSSMLTQACYYAGIALDVAGITPGNIVAYSLNHLSVLWDLVSNSFVQEITANDMNDRAFLDFNLSSTFSLPYWVLSIGYSCTCIVI